MTRLEHYQQMTRQEQIETDFMEDLLQWPADKIYNTFGSRLETIVNQQKEKLQLKLRTIWRNRRWYAFRDTGVQFENDTMRVFFEPQKVKKYSLSQLERILEKIEDETLHSNPKLQK